MVTNVANHKEFSNILEILKENPQGMSVKQIAEAIGMNRISVARYLDILLISGQVDMVPFGQAKVYTLTHRVPVNALLNFSSDYVVVLGRDQKIIQANTKFLSLFNQNLEEIQNKHLMDVLTPLSPDLSIQAKIDRALEGRVVVEEVRILKDEEELFFQMKIIPTAFIDGTPGITIILEDITERKRSIEALMESEEKFRTLVKNINTFLGKVEQYAQMNDNIRNPLQVIVGFADLEGGETMEKITRQAEEIDQMIQKLDIGWRESENIRRFLQKHTRMAEAAR